MVLCVIFKACPRKGTDYSMKTCHSRHRWTKPNSQNRLQEGWSWILLLLLILFTLTKPENKHHADEYPWVQFITELLSASFFFQAVIMHLSVYSVYTVYVRGQPDFELCLIILCNIPVLSGCVESMKVFHRSFWFGCKIGPFRPYVLHTMW